MQLPLTPLHPTSPALRRSAFGEQRSNNIQNQLDRKFKKTLMENFSLTRDLLRHFFELKRQKELMGANFGAKKEKVRETREGRELARSEATKCLLISSPSWLVASLR